MPWPFGPDFGAQKFYSAFGAGVKKIYAPSARVKLLYAGWVGWGELNLKPHLLHCAPDVADAFLVAAWACR